MMDDNAIVITRVRGGYECHKQFIGLHGSILCMVNNLKSAYFVVLRPCKVNL